MTPTATATARIRIPYTTSPLIHHANVYIRGLAKVGADWMHNSRTLDENDQLWTDSAQGYADALSYLLDDTTTFGVAELQRIEGIVWTTKDTVALTNTHGGGTQTFGQQLTLSLRDPTNYHVKVCIMEPNESGPFVLKNPTGGDANMDSFIAEFLSTHAGTHSPWIWMVGRMNEYLTQSPFISLAIHGNRKLERARGLA